MKDGWKHLYGVMEASENLKFSSINIEDQSVEVYTVPCKELSAIVSNTSCMDYKTMTKDIVIRYLLDHQKVIERVMSSYPIIPFKFGSLAHTEEEVRQILIRGYDLFKSLLPWVGKRVEFELVATWDREQIFKTLYEQESEIRSLQEMIEKKSEKEALLEKIKLGKLVSQHLIKRRYLFKDNILSKLKGCVESQCDHDVMDDLMILNTAFLLRKEMESEFDLRIQYLDHSFLGGVCFKSIGPLPLYSFQCIKIEWLDAKEVCEALTLLDLKKDATLSDLRKAYYQKAQSIHPDKMGDLLNSPSEFEKVVKAYRLLSRCYCAYKSLPREDSIFLMEVRINGSND